MKDGWFPCFSGEDGAAGVVFVQQDRQIYHGKVKSCDSLKIKPGVYSTPPVYGIHHASQTLSVVAMANENGIKTRTTSIGVAPRAAKRSTKAKDNRKKAATDRSER